MSNPTDNPRPQEFKWAHERNANLREPVDTLKEKGWQYADVPTASNFNWLFNQIQKEFESIKADIKSIKESADNIKNTADSALYKARLNQHNLNITFSATRSICMLLRRMEGEIRRYHTNFPSQPWPLNDDSELDRRPHLINDKEEMDKII